MANPDRATGFTPVKHRNGGSWNNALAERALVNDETFDENAAGTIGIGTPVVVASTGSPATETGPLAGLVEVVQMTDEDTASVYGVVVGIGSAANGDTLNQEIGPYDPSNLEGPNFVTPAEVEASPLDKVLYIAPAQDWIFEAQVEAATENYVGQTYSLSGADDATAEQVNESTGRSNLELVTGDEVQLRCVGIPERPDNDPVLAAAKVLVQFVDPWTAAESQ